MVKWIVRPVLWGLGIFIQLWSFGVIYFCSFPSNPTAQKISIFSYIALVVIFVLFSKKKTKALLLSFIGYLAILVWFSSIEIPMGGIYPDNLVMPYADIRGEHIALHNVRNCNYRTKDDFDVRYETRKYDLEKLETLDVLINYWGNELVSHAFLSFGFSDGQYVAVSIEIRPEVGESYGEFKGLFKQYEIIYIWADERDLVGLRTNYKNEDVYLYRTILNPEKVRLLFLSMIERTNDLYEHPEFYNTCTQSCTNTIGDHIIKTGIEDLPFWKRRVLTGTTDKRLYNGAWIEGEGAFEALRTKSHINDSAKAAGKEKDFSSKIRMHLSSKDSQ